MAKLAKTNTPGIFRRHAKECSGRGRCECAYVVVWRHRGRQASSTHRTFAEAREAKAQRETGERRPTSRVRVGDYFAEWIKSYAGRTSRGFSESTRPEYRRPIEDHVLPRWGTWRLSEVEPADVRELLGELRRTGRSTSYLRKLRAALSTMFATAVEDNLLRVNPVAGVRIPAARDPEQGTGGARALTRSELGTLLAAIEPEWRLFFEFLAHTGLRISEMIGLTWEHLDLGERPRVAVREQFYKRQRKGLKSGAGRRDVPLSTGMADRLLAQRRDAYGGPRAPVFPSKRGTELHPSNVRGRVLIPTTQAVGMEWVTFHTFRHTCASMLFEAGRNVKQVQEWLGHADPSFTLRTYVHLMDAGVGDAEFLDRAVRVNTGSTPGQQNARKQPQTGARPDTPQTAL